jgi:V/A-type H+-transporting ATPase subunit A
MSTASTTWISGPVLRARPDGSFVLREAVTVGPDRLLGEVIRIARDQIVVQVYEDTSGLRPGAEVAGSGRLLSVRLGPGLLGHIFDGLLRPMSAEAGAYVTPGMHEEVPAAFDFRPRASAGDRLAAGAVLGETDGGGNDNGNGRAAWAQRCLVPPDSPGGEVVFMVPPGSYREDAPVCRLRDAQGGVHELAMSHRWPVRIPRPVQKRLPSDEPMVTGQRVIDCLFPIPRGGDGRGPRGLRHG